MNDYNIDISFRICVLMFFGVGVNITQGKIHKAGVKTPTP